MFKFLLEGNIGELLAPIKTPEQQLFVALQNGETNKALELLNVDRVNPFYCNEKGVQPVHLASKHNLFAVLDVLLQFGADVNVADRQGDTPLHCAASAGHLEMCQRLISIGAKAEVRNSFKQTAYEVATNHDVRQFLLPIQLKAESEMPEFQQTGPGLSTGYGLAGTSGGSLASLAPPPLQPSFQLPTATAGALGGMNPSWSSPYAPTPMYGAPDMTGLSQAPAPTPVYGASDMMGLPQPPAMVTPPHPVHAPTAVSVTLPPTPGAVPLSPGGSLHMSDTRTSEASNADLQTQDDGPEKVQAQFQTIAITDEDTPGAQTKQTSATNLVNRLSGGGIVGGFQPISLGAKSEGSSKWKELGIETTTAESGEKQDALPEHKPASPAGAPLSQTPVFLGFSPVPPAGPITPAPTNVSPASGVFQQANVFSGKVPQAPLSAPVDRTRHNHIPGSFAFAGNHSRTLTPPLAAQTSPSHINQQRTPTPQRIIQPDGFHTSTTDPKLQAHYGHTKIMKHVAPPPVEQVDYSQFTTNNVYSIYANGRPPMMRYAVGYNVAGNPSNPHFQYQNTPGNSLPPQLPYQTQYQQAQYPSTPFQNDATSYIQPAQFQNDPTTYLQPLPFPGSNNVAISPPDHCGVQEEVVNADMNSSAVM